MFKIVSGIFAMIFTLIFLLFLFLDQKDDINNIDIAFSKMLYFFEQHNDKYKKELISIKDKSNNKIIKEIARQMLKHWDSIDIMNKNIIEPILLYEEMIPIEEIEKCQKAEQEIVSHITIEICVKTNGRSVILKFLKGSPKECQRKLLENYINSKFWLPAMKDGKYIEQNRALTWIIELR